ncbi:MAG: GNAT family N-acetyltransferase [Phycisphaerales bacterium]|nr:GNAT family N-acetyltransferase [Phycisphaerales bacterium]
MTRNAAVRIREAKGDDAEGIAAVHHAAVHHAGAEAYPPDVLQHWSGPLNRERITDWQHRIVDPDEHFMVAESEGVIIGFGSILAGEGRLRGTYVKPEHARAGIGRDLLENLEQLAISSGVNRLQVDSSLNARHFYEAHGYETLEQTTHLLEDGFAISCIRMAKVLKDD